MTTLLSWLLRKSGRSIIRTDELHRLIAERDELRFKLRRVEIRDDELKRQNSRLILSQAARVLMNSKHAKRRVA